MFKPLAASVVAVLFSSPLVAASVNFSIEQIRPYRTTVNHDSVVRFNLEPTVSGGPTPTGTISASVGPDSCTVTTTTLPLTCTIRRTVSGVRILNATYSGDLNYTSATSFFLFPTGNTAVRRVSGHKVISGGSPAHLTYNQPGSVTNKALSADGRSAVFTSTESGLTEEANLGLAQIYFSNMNSGATFLVSKYNGAPGDRPSSRGAIARSSKTVAFASEATNLWSSVGNGTQNDVYVSNFSNGVFAKISTTSAGADVQGNSSNPDISDDGRYVVFDSTSKQLTNDINQQQAIGVFLKDVQTGQITLISKSNGGSTGWSLEPKISGDGQFVFFVSDSSLFSNNSYFQIVKYTISTNLVEVISTKDNLIGNGDSFELTTNTNGSKVGFISYASNLTQAADSRPNYSDVLVRNSNGLIEQASANFPNTSACAQFGSVTPSKPSIADNGKITFQRILFLPNSQGACEDQLYGQLFQSYNGIVTPVNVPNFSQRPIYRSNGILSKNGDAFIYSTYLKLAALDSFNDLDFIIGTGNTNEYVTANVVAESNFDSEGAKISPQGRYVGFNSYASNLVPNDNNSYNDLQSDAFILDLATLTTKRVNEELSGGTGSCNDFYCNALMLAVNDDGSALFNDNADHGATSNGIRDIYLRLLTGTFERVSVATNGNFANADSQFARNSANGNLVLFSSLATNLVANDQAYTSDIFLRDRVAGTTTVISKNLAGTPMGGASSPAITANGNQFGYCSSEAIDSTDTNTVSDCFLAQPNTTPVRITGDAGQFNGSSDVIDIANSATTNRTVILTRATNVKTGILDLNSKIDAYLFIDGQIRLISAQQGAPSVAADGDTVDARLSPDGTKVVLLSRATNLVSGDTNGVTDVFVYDIATSALNRITPPSFGGSMTADATSIATSGSKTAFSTGSPFVKGDTNGWSDIYIAE